MNKSLLFDISHPLVPFIGKNVRSFFPVRRIYCVGQNYNSMAEESGCVTTKAFPYFSTKPSDSVVTDLNCKDLSVPVELQIPYPSMTESFQHEVEMVVAIGPHKKNKESIYRNLAPEEVTDVILGYAVGLDMTRRDLQLQLKRSQHPWDLAKGPDHGAVLSPLTCATTLQESNPSLFCNSERSGSVVCNGKLSLCVNGKQRQTGCLSDLILTVEEAISRLTKYVDLLPGDLIYTGTPGGVGPVRRGDILECCVEGIGSLKVTIGK